MKITFDAEVDQKEVDPIETDIEIPDLPSIAPPSTKGARKALMKFNDEFSYQLTWAQWLNDKLVECCDEIAENYEKISEENMELEASLEASVAKLLDDLFDMEQFGMMREEFRSDAAIMTRDFFEMNQEDPATAIPVIPSGIVIEEPPVDCQQETFAARDALQIFSDNIADLQTYEKWLQGELKK